MLTLPRRNPKIAAQVSFIRSRPAQIALAILAIVFLLPLLAAVPFLRGRATVLFWLAVMCAGAVLFAIMWQRAKARGEDLAAVFAGLPTTAEEPEPVAAAMGED